MKFRMVMAATTAAALSFAAAGSAAAQTLGHPDRHRPAAAKITGSRLAKGLLPASAYGTDFKFFSSANSGGKLLSTRAQQTPSSQSCGSFANYYYYNKWGNTAGADVQYLNPDWLGTWPFTQYSVIQDVLQFATVHAASTYFNQAYAKYAACKSFPVPNPSDTTPGGGSYQVSDTSTRKVTVSGHQAFWAGESWSPSGASGFTDYLEILYAISGTDVYELEQVSGTTDEPSTALMSELVQRVQALYR